MENPNVKLSILICSVDRIERQENLNKLIHELNHQICSNYAEEIIEVLIEKDNGEMSVGGKRNVLIDKAQGEYICFIDDDDFIASNYLNTILQNLKKDILLIRIEHLIQGVKSTTIQPSLYIDNLVTNELIYCANHLHLCPHKRLISKQIKFKELNFSEDIDYSQRIIPTINSYDLITEALYIYNDNIQNSLTRNV
jgi:glycosyltransferase involved in cell wall biosynthesis